MKRLFTLTAVLTFVLAAHGAPPETVHFQSLDGKTTLVAYLFHPGSGRREKAPAIVMLHGRAGPYSSLAKGIYDATRYRSAIKSGASSGLRAATLPCLWTVLVLADIRRDSGAAVTMSGRQR